MRCISEYMISNYLDYSATATKLSANSGSAIWLHVACYNIYLHVVPYLLILAGGLAIKCSYMRNTGAMVANVR